ncbi:ATPase [Microbacterium sp. zg.B48]|uniref:ATPase n=1 Tax=unclassified Microbacterium TaxID=2609290 RepID=UPI00214C84B3|nr:MULTISPECIES: ATPase [unclassified Microbacterium]MCR2761994.1 ATPase [Microbacterium sp. zg.B48]MCR2811047.1 ATPase [Microbacterium sp. zg.B185]WIM17699.1 ATPase [Microbacterium sp. zg-B185]
MKSLLWFLFGVIGGFVAAHLMNKDPRGHEVLADVDARITEFTDRIGDAYREQEARFSGIVDEVKDAASDAYGAAKASAADAVDAVKDGATDAVAASADAASRTVDAGESAAKKLTD